MVDTFECLAIRVADGRVEVLDQRHLPGQEVWLHAASPGDMIGFIKQLSVRGAPLIGIAAAYSLAAFAAGGASEDAIRKAAEDLRAARPTAVNLMWAMDRMLKALGEGGAAVLPETAKLIREEDQEMCERMAKHGAKLVGKGERILTHCNTGGLATGGIGTAIGVLVEAHRQGKDIHVYVDETRPLLQGGRLTTYELGKWGIKYTLITDSMAATLMRDGKIDRVLVGADRIATNGDFANKIGTYSVAVVAKYHNVPFHGVAPVSTIDFSCAAGSEIPIEQRKPAEVRGFKDLAWAPECDVFNPAFDVTPASLVTSLILDSGVFEQSQLEKGALKGLEGA